jgi:hypothetical protein
MSLFKNDFLYRHLFQTFHVRDGAFNNIGDSKELQNLLCNTLVEFTMTWLSLVQCNEGRGKPVNDAFITLLITK